MQSTKEEIRDLERVRYVTENYERLQGLKMMPVGVLMLALAVFALLRIDWPGMTSEEEGALFGVLLIFGGIFGCLAASLASWVISGRYEQRYGKARRSPISRWAGVLIVLGAVSFYVAHTIDIVLMTPMYLPYLVVGVAGIVFWWPERRFRIHYLFVAVTFLLVGFLPLAGVLPGNYFGEALGLLFLHLGISVIVIGLLDHLLLIHTLKTVPED